MCVANCTKCNYFLPYACRTRTLLLIFSITCVQHAYVIYGRTLGEVLDMSIFSWGQFEAPKAPVGVEYRSVGVPSPLGRDLRRDNAPP